MKVKYDSKIEMSKDTIFIPLNQSKIKKAKVTESLAQARNGPEFKDGAVKKLVLTNFMVHQKLELEFGPNVNIITGANGSGKSAILQGLVIALGNSMSISFCIFGPKFIFTLS